jgi:hypothetical protein
MDPALTDSEYSTLIWALRLDGSMAGRLYRPGSAEQAADMQTLSDYGYLTHESDGAWVITPAGRTRGISLRAASMGTTP